jgi:positive regulator of sigma E activity
MIRQKMVVRRDHGRLTLEKQESGCHGCQEACTSAFVAAVLGPRPAQEWMPEIAHGQFAEGDQLELGIEERDLLRISFWTYGVPLMGLLVGALTGEVFDQPGVEWGQMLGGLTGLIFALIFVRRARLPNFINPDLHIKKQ